MMPFTLEDKFRPYVACLPLALLLPAGTSTTPPHPAEQALQCRGCSSQIYFQVTCPVKELFHQLHLPKCHAPGDLAHVAGCCFACVGACPVPLQLSGVQPSSSSMGCGCWEGDSPLPCTSDSLCSTSLSHGPPSSCIHGTRDAVIKHLQRAVLARGVPTATGSCGENTINGLAMSSSSCPAV